MHKHRKTDPPVHGKRTPRVKSRSLAIKQERRAKHAAQGR